MTVAGEMDVQVKYGSQRYKLPLLVVSGKGLTLLRSDWLQHIRLDWKTIGINTLDNGCDQVQSLLKKYPQVFQDRLGAMQHFQATLHVRQDTKAVFCKPRSVPFALKDAVGKELNRLESEGILQRVNHSNWAAPIVPVPSAICTKT